MRNHCLNWGFKLVTLQVDVCFTELFHYFSIAEYTTANPRLIVPVPPEAAVVHTEKTTKTPWEELPTCEAK